MRTVLCLLVCLGVTLCLLSPSALSGEKSDFLVNDDGGNSEQNHPRISVGSDGSFVIAWVDRRSGSADIYLQRFDPEGQPVDPNLKVNDDVVDAFQAEPAIQVDGSFRSTLVWQDYRNGQYPFDPDIFLQRYDSALSPNGSNRNVTELQPDSLKGSPDLAISAWGGGLVVWSDYRNRNWDIYGQLISSDGSPIGGNFRINNDVGNAQQHRPRVAVSPEGWFVAVWYDNRLGNDDIFAQRIDSAGSFLGANIKVNSDFEDIRQAFPDVATDGGGHFTVVWVDWRNGAYPANPDIYSRKFDTLNVPLTPDTRINRDGTLRAQREPAISADRRGNVAIIWADSTGSSWDIAGQMIDVDGIVREANFQANSDADSAQLHPDVALDGRFRYVTWADKRNGNFDIYASISQYNDPSLDVTPIDLAFVMHEGGSLPPPQTLAVDHLGYNQISFNVLSNATWLSVSPQSSQTPADLSVEIVTDTLPFGSYFGLLILVDPANSDSSVTVSVRLDVSAPLISLQPDSLSFVAFHELTDTVSAGITVANAGIGSFAWSAIANVPWLSLSPSVGFDGDSVVVLALPDTLPPGDYEAAVEFNSQDARNTPESLYVSLTVVDNQPFLSVEPKSLYITTTDSSPVGRQITITNTGVGLLDWTAVAEAGWLQLDKVNGNSPDSLGLTIDVSSLGPGLHESAITIYDSAAFNQSISLPVSLDYLLAATDTLILENSTVTPEQSGSISIRLKSHQTIARLSLPLTLDQPLVTIDSVTPGSGIPAGVTVSLNLSAAPQPKIVVDFPGSDSLLPAGDYDLVDLHFTAGTTSGLVLIERTDPPNEGAYAISELGERYDLAVLPGEIVVGVATSATDSDDQGLPSQVNLSQNYPNPFNPSTRIELYLPNRSKAELEVFNILGQRTITLFSGTLPAGSHSFVWDGRFRSGQSAPSGIYFYRLRADGSSSVRKMVLLK